MSVMADPYRLHQPEDVGEILIKVQEDLQHLKDKLVSQGHTGPVDVTSLENAISKTEDGIKARTASILQQINNRVMTLPSLEAAGRQDAHDPADYPRTVATQQLQPRELIQPPHQVVTLKRLPDSLHRNNPDISLIGPSPGQQLRGTQQFRAIANPYNAHNRQVMYDNYGVQLPLINQRKSGKFQADQVVRGSTVEPLAVLPAANRIDPQLLPPAITEDDARKGILSLMDRGLIPPGAELSLDPSPVRHKPVLLHDLTERDRAKQSLPDLTAGFRMDGTLVKVPRSESREMEGAGRTAQGSKYSTPSSLDLAKTYNGSHMRKQSASHLKTPVPVKNLEVSLQPMPPPTTPASAPEFKEKHNRIAIQHGRTRDSTSEFVTFRQHYCLSWGSIVTMLCHLEKMLTNYSVPLAFIDGDKLADLSLEYELERTPSVDDLLSVIINREDVESIIRRPGRRYVGPRGRDLAAAKIQATYRMWRSRLAYLEFRRKKWAAGMIALTWVMQVKMGKVRQQLKLTRAALLDAFKDRHKKFAKNWSRIKNSKRVVIHIPSLGHSQHLRSTMSDYNNVQNKQMARLCEISDPNVDVIYVSPVALSDEMTQYYSKLLGLKAAIDSGNANDQADLSSRYKILTPEAASSFPSHNMCLSTLLKYSNKTLKRLKNLIRGREAYIVTGVPHHDDLYVSDYLGVPVLSPTPDVAHLYSTKSGSKRVFASANVQVPPGEYDIYSLPQLHECLAQLITDHLEVGRWLFKLDDEFDGRGMAILDVAEHLPCFQWALKEAQRYGDKWQKKWAQEAALIKISAEIPEVLAKCAQPMNSKAYSSWDRFLEAFLAQGGVVEASPPSDSVTSVTVDLVVAPDGAVSVLCSGDQIHADTLYTSWGLSFPQSSVEPQVLNDACNRVAEACKTRGVIGPVAIDFVTFIHPKTMVQELWAVDLDLSYTDSAALFHMMKFSTGGSLNPVTHCFDIPPPKKEEKKVRRRRVLSEDEAPFNTSRFAVMSTRLCHTNLSVVHYSVFFQMCRAHGIGYDIKEKQGTVFTLVDSHQRENMGMLSISDNLQGALATFARNLSVIHQEISAPNMQGESNFKPVIEDIEGILGTTIQNSNEADKQSD